MQKYLISLVLTWAVALPTIQSDEIYCGEPPVIQFATLEEPLEQYSINDILTYTCQFGYITKGKSNTLECKLSDSGEEAEWTEPRFSCTPQSCGDPGYINNGRRIGSLFAFPSSVKYECNEGYKLKGLATRYCQASGLWSGKSPVCEEIFCSKPRNIQNGFVTYSNLDYGSELKYKCDKGYHLNTDEIVFCTSDGKWSNTNIQCIESVCDMPQQPEYGSVQISGSNDKLLAGTLALFSCEGNRIVDGPRTSKCLETEPCKVPYLSNGIIGKYARETYYRKRIFKLLDVDLKIEDYETVYLRCSDGYEISGTNKKEESVSCKFGKWSRELQCEPASCRKEPPYGLHSQAVILNLEHGGRVLYLCDEDFKKIENETVVCEFGTWKGSPPVCKNSRCFVSDIPFPGLIKGKKSIYKHGEVFEIECDSRYQIAHPNQRELRCEDGNWKGLLPPCVAASCTKPAPEIEHGEAKIRSTVHSSIIKYSCRDPYILIENSQVQCLFGEWKGQPPKCEDSRCYLENLYNPAYLDLTATGSITFSGNKLFVICKEGYSPKPQQPVCLKGKWSGDSFSPCKENDCTVPVVYHGEIKESKLGDYYWSWKNFRYEREMKYVEIPPETVLPYGSSKTLFCNQGYFFQGTSLKSNRITCSKGKWYPDPVCLRIGQKYVPQTTTQKPYTTTLSKITEESKTVATTTKMPQISITTAEEVTIEETYDVITSAIDNTEISQGKSSDDVCYCEYPINDENLIAHADEKRLKFHDKVKNGSVVIFRCKHVGFHRLHGVKNLECKDCRNWHSSEFPTCSQPRQGNAVIIFDKTLNVSIEGDLEAKKGQDVKLMCVAVESSLYPHWNVQREDRITIKRERMERESYGDVLYISHLAIENVDIEDEGPYGCAVGNKSMNFVNLVINDPDIRCPEIPDGNTINVVYDTERRVKHKARFSCKNRNQEIDGKDVLTCQKNGKWSDDIPQCIDIKCKELKSNDLMVISYTNDTKIGSKATFHCFAPGQRSGEPFADCLENGTWSNPTPICRTPPCAMENIFSVLPEDVVPDTDTMNRTFLYNTTVKLTCVEEMIVQGEPAARCNRQGLWDVAKIECISGCPELATESNSSLILTPRKETYKLGDMVTLSCPPGMSLTTQSQRIMCLKYGWSETILPDCE